MRHRGQRLDAARTRPVSIGGDHSITGPILKALAGPGRNLSGIRGHPSGSIQPGKIGSASEASHQPRQMRTFVPIMDEIP